MRRLRVRVVLTAAATVLGPLALVVAVPAAPTAQATDIQPCDGNCVGCRRVARRVAWWLSHGKLARRLQATRWRRLSPIIAYRQRSEWPSSGCWSVSGE
jgi:hypothetical protein